MATEGLCISWGNRLGHPLVYFMMELILIFDMGINAFQFLQLRAFREKGGGVCHSDTDEMVGALLASKFLILLLKVNANKLVQGGEK
jgi:hypothetical protein